MPRLTIGTQTTSAGLAAGSRRHLQKPSLRTSLIRCHRSPAWWSEVFTWAGRYDEAIVACKKLANENPTFAPAHDCLASAYWGKRMYLQVIEEFRAYDQLSDDRNESEFSSALEKGISLRGVEGR